MSECCSKESCGNERCCCCPCHAQHAEEEKHDEFGAWFLEVADEAWMEVLKEEIKNHIKSTQGDRMKELAKLVSEANGSRWKSKMDNKKCCEEFKQRLCSFFGGHK